MCQCTGKGYEYETLCTSAGRIQAAAQLEAHPQGCCASSPPSLWTVSSDCLHRGTRRGLLGDAHPCFSHPKSPEHDICHRRACAALQIGSSPPHTPPHTPFVPGKRNVEGEPGKERQGAGPAGDTGGRGCSRATAGEMWRGRSRVRRAGPCRAVPGPPGAGNGRGLPGRQGMREPCGKGSGWGRRRGSQRGLPSGEGPRFAAATLLSADNGAGCLLRAGRQLAIHRERCVTQMSRGS